MFRPTSGTLSGSWRVTATICCSYNISIKVALKDDWCKNEMDNLTIRHTDIAKMQLGF